MERDVIEALAMIDALFERSPFVRRLALSEPLGNTDCVHGCPNVRDVIKDSIEAEFDPTESELVQCWYLSLIHMDGRAVPRDGPDC